MEPVLGIMSVYLQGIDNAEIIDTFHARQASMITASAARGRRLQTAADVAARSKRASGARNSSARIPTLCGRNAGRLRRSRVSRLRARPSSEEN
jgi:hypothetical protein